MAQRKEWNLSVAALVGAVIATGLVALALATGNPVSSGALGSPITAFPLGAVLGVAVAAIRNRIYR